MWVYIVTIFSIFCDIVTSNSSGSPILKAASVGGCYNVRDDEFIHCAAVEEECGDTPDVEFKRADELEQLGNFKCSTETLPLGVCESTEECAITKDSCADPNDYRSPSASNLCNAEGRFSSKGDFIPTQYGACKDGSIGTITCVISPADCLAEEHWIAASVVEKERLGGCRCSDVRIGICKDSPAIDPHLSTCAISADDCHPLTQTFGTARNMEDHARLDCRLCPIKAIIDKTTNKDSVDDSENNQRDNNMKKVEKDAFSRGGFFGLIIGVSFTFILSIFIITMCSKEREEGTPEMEPVNLPALV